MTQNIPVRKEFPYNKIGSWRRGDGYTIAFVYPKGSMPFIVKGGMQNVEQYIKTLKHPAIIHYTIFCHRDTRTIINIEGLKPSIFACISRKKKTGNKCHVLTVYGEYQVLLSKQLRRPPRCWMRELNQFI